MIYNDREFNANNKYDYIKIFQYSKKMFQKLLDTSCPTQATIENILIIIFEEREFQSLISA